jgi:hypothetical protein
VGIAIDGNGSFTRRRAAAMCGSIRSPRRPTRAGFLRRTARHRRATSPRNPRRVSYTARLAQHHTKEISHEALLLSRGLLALAAHRVARGRPAVYTLKRPILKPRRPRKASTFSPSTPRGPCPHWYSTTAACSPRARPSSNISPIRNPIPAWRRALRHLRALSAHGNAELHRLPSCTRVSARCSIRPRRPMRSRRPRSKISARNSTGCRSASRRQEIPAGRRCSRWRMPIFSRCSRWTARRYRPRQVAGARGLLRARRPSAQSAGSAQGRGHSDQIASRLAPKRLVRRDIHDFAGHRGELQRGEPRVQGTRARARHACPPRSCARDPSPRCDPPSARSRADAR